jgi:hypothetical protein
MPWRKMLARVGGFAGENKGNSKVKCPTQAKGGLEWATRKCLDSYFLLRWSEAELMQ